MNRMEQVFPAMLERGRKILVSYFPIGDPCVADPVDWAGRFLENGTTVLELGLPHEAPVLDGEVVRASMERALQHTDLEHIFLDISEIRHAFPNAVLQVMTYAETVLRFGGEQFAKICRGIGVDAVLSANESPALRAELDRSLGALGIDHLRFIPYHMNDSHILDLKKHGSGYAYLQAVDGATGSSTAITSQIGGNIRLLRQSGVSLPLIPGFGISTPEHVKAYLAMGADGVIVGSAIIRHILDGTGERYIKSLSDALR